MSKIRHYIGTGGLTRCGIGYNGTEAGYTHKGLGDALLTERGEISTCSECNPLFKVTHHVSDRGVVACGKEYSGIRTTKSLTQVTCEYCQYEMGMISESEKLERLFSSVPFLIHLKELITAAINYEIKRLNNG